MPEGRFRGKIRRDSNMTDDSSPPNALCAGSTPGRRLHSRGRSNSKKGNITNDSSRLAETSSPIVQVPKKTVFTPRQKNKNALARTSSPSRTGLSSESSITDTTVEDFSSARKNSVRDLIEFYTSRSKTMTETLLPTMSTKSEPVALRSSIQHAKGKPTSFSAHENASIAREYRIAAKLKQDTKRHDWISTMLGGDDEKYLNQEAAFRPFEELQASPIRTERHESISSSTHSDSSVLTFPDIRTDPIETVQDAIRIEKERFDQIKKLLAIRKFHINNTSVRWESEGYNALTCAAMNGYVDILKYLILFGANVNHVHKNGMMAVYLASKNGFYECVKILLDRGADENIETLNQALMYAVKGADKFSKFPHKYQCCDKVVRLLVSRGASVNYMDPNQNGKTPLMQLVEWHYNEPSSGWPMLLLEVLLNHGADMNQCNKEGISAYALAKKLQGKSPISPVSHANLSSYATNPFLEALESHTQRSKSKVKLFDF